MLGLGSEFQLGLGVRSGARIRDRAKIKVKFMGSRVRYVSMVSVWVHLAATDGFRVRLGLIVSFKVGLGLALGLQLGLNSRPALISARLRVRVRIRFRFRVKVRNNARLGVRNSFRARDGIRIGL